MDPIDPIETLMQEHREIERQLEALVLYAERASGGGQASTEGMAAFVRFFREFADRRHHGKEEKILFAKLRAMGFPADSGPLSVMYADHEEGRRLLGELEARASDEDRARLVETARRYREHLCRHILKEDRILYPIAQSRLSDEEYEEMGRQFAEFESKEEGHGR
jgi:hemerythrin-like domain-containing protein